MLLVGSMILFTACSSGKLEETGESTPGEESSVETEKINSENDELIQSLLSDWFDYLHVTDYMYGDMLWVLDYVEQFLEKPSWSNLQIARAALSTAEQYIDVREKPEEKMSADDYAKLLKKGYDVAVVTVEGDSFEQTKSIVLSDCNLLKSGLHMDIFWQDTFDGFKNYVAMLKELYVNQITEINVTTEYILLTINDEAWSKKFHDFVNENCIALNKYPAGKLENAEAAYDAMDALLDTIENIIEEQYTYLVGEERATLYELSEAIDNGNFAMLQEAAVEIEDAPIQLPFPRWSIVDDSFGYYYYDLEDENHYPVEQEVLTDKPDGYMIRYHNADKDSLVEYQTLLSSLGLDPYKVEEENGEYEVTYYFRESFFMLKYSEGGVDLFVPDGNVDFIPYWYFKR